MKHPSLATFQPEPPPANDADAVRELRGRLVQQANVRGKPISLDGNPPIADVLLPAMKTLLVFFINTGIDGPAIEPFRYIVEALEAGAERVKHPLFAVKGLRTRPRDRTEVWSQRLAVARLLKTLWQMVPEKHKPTSIADDLYAKLSPEIEKLRSRGRPRGASSKNRRSDNPPRKGPARPSRMIESWVTHFDGLRQNGDEKDPEWMKHLRIIYENSVARNVEEYSRLSHADRKRWIDDEVAFIREEIQYFAMRRSSRTPN